MASILVTGASRGIGAAIAEALADAGFVVGCVSRSGSLPERPNVRADSRARWVPIQADVTNRQALDCAFQKLVAEEGPLVGVINNAGVHAETLAVEMSSTEWNFLMETNALSTVYGCQAAYPYLVEAGGGLIVNIGSFFDKLGVKRNLAYCASKAAVGAITRVLAVEWARAAIRVVNVAPGYVLTDLNRDALNQGPLKTYLSGRIPVGRPGTSEEVAALVTLLFARGLEFLTGETLYLDGGQGIAH